MPLVFFVSCISSPISYRFFGWKPSVISDWLIDVREDLKSRHYSFVKYKDEIAERVERSLDSFKNKQLESVKKTEDDLQDYIRNLNDLYNDALSQLEKQRVAIDELNKRKQARSPSLDESLDQFKKAYNESVDFMLKWPEVEFKKHIRKIAPSWQHKDQSKDVDFIPFRQQMEQLDRALQSQWESVAFAATEGSRTADRLRKQLLNDFRSIQDNITISANIISDQSKTTIQKALSKREAKREKVALETQLKRLESEGKVWLDDRAAQLEAVVRNLQEKLTSSTSLYDELVSRKKSQYYYSSLTDSTLSQVLKLIDPADEGWDLIRSQDGISVMRKFMGSSAQSFKYACVRAEGVLRASPAQILSLFEDNTRVSEYNKFFGEGRDLEEVGENTKVVWASSPPIFPFKPRDFCTVVHFRRLRDGTVVVLNRATEHPEAPVNRDFVRAKIVLGANIIQPVRGHPNRCRLVVLTQVDPGGFAPPMIVNQICTMGPIGFFKLVEEAARRPASRQILKLKKELAAKSASSAANRVIKL